MKQCPKCKADVSNTAKFCIKCGFNIKKHEEESLIYFCSECGAKFSGGKFCPLCGKNIEKDIKHSSIVDEIDFSSYGLDFSQEVEQVKQINTISNKIKEEYKSFEFEVYGEDEYIITKYIDVYQNEVVIPKNTISIGKQAFEGTFITSVKLNEGLKSIGKRAFANCQYLKDINFPKTLDKIDDEAFSDCEQLEIKIPKTVTIIGKNIFYNPQKYVDTFKSGLELFNKGDYSEAFKLFKKSADKKNKDAMYYIGVCYRKGLGVKCDLDKAMEYINLAAKNKQPQALKELASTNNDFNINLLVEAADLGDLDSQLIVAEMYYNGNGITKNYKKAYKYYLLAAEQGNLSAMNIVSRMLDKGMGVKKDYFEASEWALKAARGDIPESQYRMGQYLENGVAGYDLTKAYEWYTKAAKALYPDAMFRLWKDNVKDLSCLANDEVDELEKIADLGFAEAQFLMGEEYFDTYAEADAIEWYLKAARQGHIMAMNKCAILLEKNYDYEEAYKWYLKAANNGVPYSMYKVGYFLYYKRKSVKEDTNDAYDWYLKAAKKKEPNAMYELGWLHHLEEDYSRAYEWYLKAANLGVVNAQNNIAKLLIYGKGVKQDYKKACEWWNRAIADDSSAVLDYAKAVGDVACDEKDYNKYNKACDLFKEAIRWGNKLAESEYNKFIKCANKVKWKK